MHRQSLARWYVYELVDSRSGEVFYVGKGTGRRIDAHEQEAIRKPEVCSRKLNKIRDILNCGASVEKRKVAFFWDEQAAYDHETDVIDEYGLSSLTNVLPGGQKAWEHRRADREQRRPIKPLDQSIERELRTPNSALFARFADWFRFGGHKGQKIKATALDPSFKWNAEITEVCYNTMFHNVLKMFMSKPEWRQKFAEVMRHHGLEIVYGRA